VAGLFGTADPRAHSPAALPASATHAVTVTAMRRTPRRPS
jgi:hypothetical protein